MSEEIFNQSGEREKKVCWWWRNSILQHVFLSLKCFVRRRATVRNNNFTSSCYVSISLWEGQIIDSKLKKQSFFTSPLVDKVSKCRTKNKNSRKMLFSGKENSCWINKFLSSDGQQDLCELSQFFTIRHCTVFSLGEESSPSLVVVVLSSSERVASVMTSFDWFSKQEGKVALWRARRESWCYGTKTET